MRFSMSNSLRSPRFVTCSLALLGPVLLATMGWAQDPKPPLEDAPAPDKTAFEGCELKGAGLTVAQAQLAVRGERGKYGQFASNVRTAEARDFWRPRDVSPTGQGHHYNHNAESYTLVGDVLGRAMLEMHGLKK